MEDQKCPGESHSPIAVSTNRVWSDCHFSTCLSSCDPILPAREGLGWPRRERVTKAGTGGREVELACAVPPALRLEIGCLPSGKLPPAQGTAGSSRKSLCFRCTKTSLREWRRLGNRQQRSCCSSGCCTQVTSFLGTSGIERVGSPPSLELRSWGSWVCSGSLVCQTH